LKNVAIVGGGPAGLMAAEVLALGGVQVDLYDGMPSVGRKFLLAGKGGLNLTHSEPYDAFVSRYAERSQVLLPLLDAFGPQAFIAWVRELGFEVFTGSSGRIFPADLKAAPLLRAWLHRLRGQGVRFHLRHRWTGWSDAGALRFVAPQGEVVAVADALLLAAGGGSWPKLGSDGAWVPLLESREVAVATLRPANCGFDVEGRSVDPSQPANANRPESEAQRQSEESVSGSGDSVAVTRGWSEHFRSRFAGHPLKPVAVSFTERSGATRRRQGEFVITETGFEGSLIYALSAAVREEIAACGSAVIHLDLLPDKYLAKVAAEIAHPRGSRSMSSHLQSRLGLKGVKTALLRESVPAADFTDPARLAAAVKALPVRLIAPRPLAEAISTAGGVSFDALDARLMIRGLPGVFCAGEMLDWEAPTGGYLLTACVATGRAAGQGVLDWFGQLPGERLAAGFERNRSNESGGSGSDDAIVSGSDALSVSSPVP